MTIEYLLLIGSILLLVSITMAKFLDRFGLPALLLFLGIGMLAGSEGPGGIYFDDARLAQWVGVVSLIFILFSGGLDTDWSAVRPVFWQGISLATIGVILTALLMGFFVSLVFNISLLEGLLLGSIVSSTDAAAVFSILRSKNVSLRGELRPLLELESGSNDPMAVLLTITLIQILTSSKSSFSDVALLFILQMGLGTIFGFLFGKTMIILLNRFKFYYEGLYPVFSLAYATLIYTLTAICGGSGFLAVYIAGILVGNSKFKQKRSLIRFLDGIAWLSQIIMFLTLGLLVFPSRLVPIIQIGLFVSAFLMLVARPFSVFIGLLLTKLHWRDKVFISWVGLRGAVPVILATFPLIAQLPNAELIFNVVFFIVLTSTLLQGWPIPLLARILKVDAPLERKRRYPIEFEPTEGMEAELVDLIVPYDAAVAGKPISKIGLPPKSLIVLINRNDKFIVPSGEISLKEGDAVLILVNKDNLAQVREIFNKQKPIDKA